VLKVSTFLLLAVAVAVAKTSALAVVVAAATTLETCLQVVLTVSVSRLVQVAVQVWQPDLPPQLHLQIAMVAKVQIQQSLGVQQR